MKKRFTREMWQQVYVGMAIAFFAIVCYFLFIHFSVVLDTWSKVKTILLPFFGGFAIAFLLNPLMVFIEGKLLKNASLKKKTKRTVAVLLTLVIAIIVVAFIVYLIVPSVVDSVSDLIKNREEYLSVFTNFVETFFESHDIEIGKKELASITGKSEQIYDLILAYLGRMYPKIITASYNMIMVLFKVLIGIAAGMYLLLDKELFIRHVKKINYGIMPKEIAVYFHKVAILSKKVFIDFISGKAIDSLIIGILCYIGLSLMGIKYAALLSVIVGVTNMIPVFGPFIGAIPGVLILLIVNPIQSIYFALFILALQQFDGNILGPLILGDKLGIASFWILFSVTIGGSFFGVIGMFIGVPVFAVIYGCVKEFINMRLDKKRVDIFNQE